MDTTIITPIGCVTVKDERIKESVEAAYEHFYAPRNIEERKISDVATQGSCKVATPFGYSCARSYASICNSEGAVIRIFKGEVTKDIVFAEIS